MRVLIACERSQVECTAFREAGIEAYSCDIRPEYGGHPEWHIQDDVLKQLEGWDMIIAHPPCTYLCAASAVRLYNKDHSIKDYDRYKKGLEATAFFIKLYYAPCDKIAIENPRPLKCWGLPISTQVIQPFMFGEPWRKETHLWLKGLPPLMATEIVEPLGLWVGSTSARRQPDIKQKYILHSNRNPDRRSKSFEGIAKAMAYQWT